MDQSNAVQLFFVYVQPKDKDRVLLALMEALYGGHRSAVDEFTLPGGCALRG